MQRRLTLLLCALVGISCIWLVVRHGAAASGVILGLSNDASLWVQHHPMLGGALFVVAATLGKITPLPGGLVLMLAGGLLFGPIVGPVLSALGAALSALLVAWLGRLLVHQTIAARFGPRLSHLEQVIREDGGHWLFAARLVPILPAWLVNLVPVLFPIPLRAVFLATLLGILPIAFIVGGVGSRLASLAEAETVPSEVLFTPGVLVPLAALALLAVAPVVIKRVRRKKPAANEPPAD